MYCQFILLIQILLLNKEETTYLIAPVSLSLAMALLCFLMMSLSFWGTFETSWLFYSFLLFSQQETWK
jgi:hypothetical protein